MLFQRNKGGDWLIVGLGNPGSKYWNTRHNVGFAAMDALADSLHARVDRVKFQGLTGTAELDGKKLILLKPTTYMNLSGQAVSAAARFYKIPPERILVVSDEVSLPVGALRIRAKGSAGGHNGLKSIISVLGTDAFPRIRLGVGSPPHPDYDMADWVLSAFHDQDAVVMRETAGRAAEAVECCIVQGLEKAMSLYNQKTR